MNRIRALPLALLTAACATAPPRAADPPPAPAVPETTVRTPLPEPGSVLADSTNAPLPEPAVLETATGQATWYSDRLAGRLTASGIPYRPEDLIAAHRSYPFGTVLRVTNLKNGRSVVVRVVDRGPWGNSERQRATIVDLSRAAAEQLDYIRDGRVPVQVDVLEWGTGR